MKSMNISNIREVPVHISKGNSKLGAIPNISLRPILDCGENSFFCRRRCYAMKAYRLYPASRNAYGHNSSSFRNHMHEAFKILERWFHVEKPEFFRIHVAGDFLGQEYLDGWIDICKDNPDIRFMSMTKMFKLDYADVPSNLNIRFSMWSKMEIPRKKMSKVWIDDGIEIRIPEDIFRCTGKCTGCYYCWEYKDDIVIHLH